MSLICNTYVFTITYPLINRLQIKPRTTCLCYFDLPISNEINPERKNGMTPLHFAASYGHYDICKFIIEKINVKNPRDSTDGTTPLHMAAGNGHTNVCRLIIDLVVDKNPRNDYGSTPLHWAAEDGHLEAYKLIFEKVEEKNPSNKNEQTPLGLAGNNGRFQILKYAGNELAN